MSEQVTPIDRAVPSHTLLRAAVRLDVRKHPAKLRAIDEEIRRLRMERRAA